MADKVVEQAKRDAIKTLSLPRKAPEINSTEILRGLRETGKKAGIKKKKEPLPQAPPEHYPGEGLLYGDWAVASRKQRGPAYG